MYTNGDEEAELFFRWNLPGLSAVTVVLQISEFPVLLIRISYEALDADGEIHDVPVFTDALIPAPPAGE